MREPTFDELIISQATAKPDNLNTYSFFKENSSHFGDYDIFEFKGRNHKRSEFIEDIEALAVYFKNDLKLKENDCFTLFIPTSAEAMMLYMALNKIGVIVNFVHPMYPADKLSSLVDFTASSGICIFDKYVEQYAETLKAKGLPVIVITPSEYALQDKYSAKLSPEAQKALQENDIKYDVYNKILEKYDGKKVDDIFDSGDRVALYLNGGGTTGVSRTIQLSNAALNYVVWGIYACSIKVNEVGVDTEICCMPFFHAYGFCAGGLTSINKGVKCVFMPKFDADEFIQILKRDQVTQFSGVPNMFKKLLEHPEFDGPHLKNMRVMFVGGDDLKPDMLHKIIAIMKKNGSDAEVCGGYGLTECGAVCAKNLPWKNKVGSLGKPISTLNVEIWDENDKRVPTGKSGQIVMSGKQIMVGYLNEERTPDDGIFFDENGTRWVKTGDMGYYDEDGYLHFLGRIKRIFIISGYNVYPADIEKLLTDLPFLNETCAVQGFIGEKKIVRLFAVKNPDTNLTEEEMNKQIIDYISKKMDKFNIPSEIVYIDALPRTLVQKVDFMKLTETEPKKQ